MTAKRVFEQRAWEIGTALAAAAVLVKWRPALALSMLINLALVSVILMLSSRLDSLEARLPKPGRPSLQARKEQWEAEATSGSPADLPSSLQRLIDGVWEWLRAMLLNRSFQEMIKKIDIGGEPPIILAVRSAPAPQRGLDLVCLNVDVLWVSEDPPPTFDLQFKLPGTKKLVPFRVKVTRLEATFQTYFWATPPQGRGNLHKRPFSFIEASLCPDGPDPVIAIELSAIGPSMVPSSMLPRFRQVAASAIQAQLFPRVTGFNNRFVVHESPLVPVVNDPAAMLELRRMAGMQQRIEVEMEDELNGTVSEISRNVTNLWEIGAEATDKLGRIHSGVCENVADAIVNTKDFVEDVYSAPREIISDSLQNVSENCQDAIEAVAENFGEVASNAKHLFRSGVSMFRSRSALGFD